MITLSKLCTEMALSGRHLTARGARDWWTKGLLPRPNKKGLGRAGSQTYWPDASILEQAAAAHDLLLKQANANATLVRLWLMGYSIEIDKLRTAWLTLITKDQLPTLRAEELGMLPQDVVGKMVTSVARSMISDRGETYDNLSAVISESFNVFFGMGEEIAGYGLAAAVKNVMIQLHPELTGSHQSEWSDEECIWALGLLRDWCSLPAQHEIIAGASKHEFARARRLLQIGFSVGGRKRQSLQAGSIWPFVIVFGRIAIPVLIKLLRQPYARDVIGNALKISREMRRKKTGAIQEFYQPGAVLSSETANHSAG